MFNKSLVLVYFLVTLSTLFKETTCLVCHDCKDCSYPFENNNKTLTNCSDGFNYCAKTVYSFRYSFTIVKGIFFKINYFYRQKNLRIFCIHNRLKIIKNCFLACTPHCVQTGYRFGNIFVILYIYLFL
jgi:hypothetical protein